MDLISSKRGVIITSIPILIMQYDICASGPAEWLRGCI